MNARMAFSLGLLLSLAPMACEEDDDCDVDLDDGDLERRICDGVDLVVDCLRDGWGDEMNIPDEQLEHEVDVCADTLTICVVDSTKVQFVADQALLELRGTDNECIG